MTKFMVMAAVLFLGACSKSDTAQTETAVTADTITVVADSTTDSTVTTDSTQAK